MRKGLGVYLLLLGSSVYAMKVQVKPDYDVIISLGSDWRPKRHLRDQNIPCEDSPFDVLGASVQSVIELIEHEFEGFLERDTITIHHGEYVLDTRYNTTLIGALVDIPHVICTNDVQCWLDRKPTGTTVAVADLQQLLEEHSSKQEIAIEKLLALQHKNSKRTWDFQKIKDILDARVQNLLALLRSDKRILFVRSDMTQDEAIALDNALKRKYPNLQYTIAAVGESLRHQDDWQLERIHNFYVGSPMRYDFYGNTEKWIELCTILGLPKKIEKTAEESTKQSPESNAKKGNGA